MNCIECDTPFEPKRKTAQFCSPYCRVKYNRKKAAEDGDESMEDATAGLHPEVLPEKRKSSTSHVVVLKETVKARILAKSPPAYVPPVEVGTLMADKEFVSSTKFIVGSFTQLPVEHHGTENDLARQVLARLPISKLDPNSEEAELVRLQKSQLRTSKKKD